MLSLKNLLLPAILASLASASCTLGPHAAIGGKVKANDENNFHEACVNGLRNQIRTEFEASLQYLLMGAHFARDDINLEGIYYTFYYIKFLENVVEGGFFQKLFCIGFSKMFFEHADEERDHGIKFLEYLRHRGDAEVNVLGEEPILPILQKYSWTDGEEALR